MGYYAETKEWAMRRLSECFRFLSQYYPIRTLFKLFSGNNLLLTVSMHMQDVPRKSSRRAKGACILAAYKRGSKYWKVK